MAFRPLSTAAGNGGGAVKLAADPRRARNIHVTVLNPTAATHAAFFGRSLRELSDQTIGIAGFAVVAVANNVVTSTVGTIAYTSFILQGWVGELWAAADIADGIISVEAYDAGSPEG